MLALQEFDHDGVAIYLYAASHQWPYILLHLFSGKGRQQSVASEYQDIVEQQERPAIVYLGPLSHVIHAPVINQ